MTAMSSLRSGLEEFLWTWRPLAVSAEVRRDIEALEKTNPELALHFAPAPISLSRSWFPSTIRPTLEDDLLGSPQPREVVDLSNMYEVEVQALDTLNETPAEDVPLAHWQRGVGAAATQMYKMSNRRAHAERWWNDIAIPVRYKDGKVYRIFRPLETYRRPVILGISAESFVEQSSLNSVWLTAEIEQKNRRIDFLTSVLVIVILVLVWRW